MPRRRPSSPPSFVFAGLAVVAFGSIGVGVWRTVRAHLAPPAVAAPSAAPAAGRTHPATPNLVLITLCSVRADHLGAYGDLKASTPHLDALAKEGIVFTHAWSTATYTLPSHASLFTGLLPAHVGVLDTSDGIPADVPTLPELLHTYGYRTLAYVPVASLASVQKGSGFERGFDQFLEGEPGAQGESALSAIDAGAEPFFLLAHFKEAHRPYVARLEAPDVDPRLVEWNRRMGLRDGPPPDPEAWLDQQVRADPAFAATMIATYDAAVTRADAEVGALVDGLRARGILDDTLVVVAGDHGEALGEGGRHGHQGYLQPEVLSVPLLVRLPHAQAAGHRVSADTSLVDVMPTLLDAAGVALPARLDGRSLLTWAHEGTLPDRPAIAQARTAGQARSDQPGEVAVLGDHWLMRVPGTAQATLLERSATGWTPAASVPPGLTQALDRLGPAAAPQGRPLTDAERAAVQKEGYW